MSNSSPLDLIAERFESLKAGTLGALALCAAFAATTGLNQGILARQFPPLAGLLYTTFDFNLLISIAVACLSGFVFGVTYRYIIREDNNSHLQEGAVLAFGLVRGMAQVDLGLRLDGGLWPLAVLGGESLLLFAFARLILDFAIRCRWVQPLPGNSRQG